MLKNRYIKYCLGFFCLLLVASCETPEKVLKNGSLDYKKNKAEYWYNKKKYANAIPVLEEVMGLMKGKESTEKYYYMYCWANYKLGDYLISAYHFKNFTSLFPNSDKAEECMYMYAKSYEKQSPKYELDQSNTFRAIEAFQTFINLYPESNKRDTANQFIDLLHRKIEVKALEAAKLYYKTENYKAAAASFDLITVQYPDIDDVEYIMYMIPKSYDKYAEKSIVSKQVERYQNVIVTGKKFLRKYPQSKYAQEITELIQNTHFKISKAAYEHADIAVTNEKEKLSGYAIKEINYQLPSITNPKLQKKAADYIVKTNLNLLKFNHLLATEAAKEEKMKLFEKTIKSYYNFADKFKDTKYIKQADRIFKDSEKQINKLKKNG